MRSLLTYPLTALMLTLEYVRPTESEMTPKARHLDRLEKRQLQKDLRRLPRLPAGLFK